MASNDLSVLAAFGQLNRNNDLRIMTKILDDGVRIFVRKEAYTKEAVPHIQRMKENHDRLTKVLSGASNNIRLVKMIGSEKNSIDFEYIKGVNLEYQAFTSILSGNYDEVANIIDTIFGLVDSLSSSRYKKESETVERINNIYRLSAESTHYINPGIVDLNLDNFMLDKNNEFVAFDYEWVFDQPIAADFIKTRLLYTFFARRSEAFAFLPNEKKIFKALLTHDTKTLIPYPLYTKYSKYLTKASMKRYWEAEDLFQKSVDSHHQNTAESNLSSFTSENLSSPTPTFPESEELARSAYEDRVNTLDTHKKELENELELIKSSQAYRVALKLRALKAKLSLK